MREELKKIEEILLNNGWNLMSPSRKEHNDAPYPAEYFKTYEGNRKVSIEVALVPDDLACYWYYGVCSVQIFEFYNPPFARGDLRDMIALLDKTEQELLDAGVPFRPDYGFGSKLEGSLGRNLELRAKYHLSEFERWDVEEKENGKEQENHAPTATGPRQKARDPHKPFLHGV